jgi:hypothetical protein
MPAVKEIQEMRTITSKQWMAVGRSWKLALLLTSGWWILAPALSMADAPDKTRDLTRARQMERERAATSAPVIPPAQVYRRYFAAMKAGRHAEAVATLTDESLRQMKATLVRALREAPLDELAKFIRDAGFKSAADLQHSAPGRVFTGWMRSGWRVQGFLQRLRLSEIASVEEIISNDLCNLVIVFKHTAIPKETVACEQRDLTWKLKLEIPLEENP